MKKAVIYTLGCRLNCADTALLTCRLERSGYRVVPEQEQDFDLAVINTCAVTAEAVRKSRQTLRRIKKAHPDTRFLVTGCAVEVNAEAFKSDGADYILTNPDKKDLESILSGLAAANRSSGEFSENFSEKAWSVFPFRSRAFVKIQEGCNNFCTYCIVPYVRGRERSRNFSEVLADCRQLVDAGFPEIVLTGVNTCAYCDGNKVLADLIHAVAEIPGDFRIRLSSTEPHFNNRNLIDIMAETPKICRFLHLSLQYGNNRILKAMNRHYTVEEYADFVSAARDRIPGLHIGTDIIAGFPGETDDDFTECLDFVEKMQFANAHIFTYSPRPGTPAATMPNRPDGKTADERAARLRKVSARSKQNFIQSQLGKELQVIFETSSKGMLHGWSDNYIAVSVPENQAKTGCITRLTATNENVSADADLL